MCGVVGVVALGGAPPDVGLVRGMCDAIVHRGPDEEGIDVSDGVGLGMRRLSIIDVEGGHQPYRNEDGRVRAVFNGEIYNFAELRSELESRGHRMGSRADGEVIVHLWEEAGPALLDRLDGMFALAVHDASTGRVLLARDRLGIKPLYYSRTPGHLVFGSEVKSILASGLVERTLDVDALGEFLSWEYVPAPGTLLREIRKLEPGGLLEMRLDDGSPRVRRWWQLPLPDESPTAACSDDEWEERVDARVRTAVRGQLVSDVPLGAFLSGGVDSSLVVSCMDAPHTFSIGFDDPSYNELAWAERVAAHVGAQHRTEVIRPDAGELFGMLMHFMDDPIGDFSIFPTYLVSRLARRHVKVVLTGDGGDEVFGGYETYVAQEVARLWTRLPGFLRRPLVEDPVLRMRPRPAKKGTPNKARRFVEGLREPAALEHARWRFFLGDALRRELLTPEVEAARSRQTGDHVLRLFDEAGPRTPLARRLYVDMRSYLSDNCLVKMDRMSMACSLEARVPLLDHGLVELAFRMPDRLRLSGRRTKPLLKRVAARRVPTECVYRPKEGFSIPIKHWLRGELRPLMEDLLQPSVIEQEGLFQSGTVDRLRREHLSGVANHSHLLWSLCVFQDWRRRWQA